MKKKIKKKFKYYETKDLAYIGWLLTQGTTPLEKKLGPEGEVIFSLMPDLEAQHQQWIWNPTRDQKMVQRYSECRRNLLREVKNFQQSHYGED